MTNKEKLNAIPISVLKNTLNSSYSMRETLEKLLTTYNSNDYVTIQAIILKNKIKYKFLLKHPQPNLKVSYFKTINSKQKAYWLGFLAADAYIKPRRLSLQLSSVDEKWMLKFLTDIGAEPSYIKHYENKKYQKPSTRSCYELTNSSFVSHIISHGFESPKSYNLRFPRLGCPKLELAFLHGYYDGDGTQGQTTITTCSKMFLEQVIKNYSLTSKLCKIKKSNTFTLCLGSKLFKRMIYNYKDSLPRKRQLKKIPIELHKVRAKKLTPDLIPIITANVYLMPMTQLAMKFNCTDNAIRKFCKRHKIIFPKKMRGKWTGKNKNGKESWNLSKSKGL